MNRYSVIVLLLACVAWSCGDSLGRIGSYRFGDDPTQDRVGEPDPFRPQDASMESARADAGVTDEDIELEELEMEDPEALSALIHDKLAAAEREPPERAEPPVSSAQTPPAYENWKLSKTECVARLKKAGVRYRKPDFETPLVANPLLLEGPVGGVEIAPRWPQNGSVNAVMDCHLVLALVEVARQARARGIEKIMFYSTYRPIRKPPKDCKRGKAGARCRRLKKAYKKTKNKPSQHRTALAIDIRWLVTKAGETIDVLEHYDRRSREDPCSYTAKDEKGHLLQSLACDLHRDRIFNVMLTPNANKAHHNHFHFDITPDAKWYIIR